MPGAGGVDGGDVVARARIDAREVEDLLARIGARADADGAFRMERGEVDDQTVFRLAVADEGYAVELRDASPGLRELLDLCGLERVLPLVDEGQPEEREQPSGVEEEIQPGDTAL